jgi:hypothetical protein
MAQSTETKLNKRFDQNIEITGTLTVGEVVVSPSSYLTSIPSEYLTQTEGDARYFKLTGGYVSGNIVLDYTGASYSNAIIFNGSSNNLGGEIGIRAKGEAFEIYEPEDAGKVWLTISDDPVGLENALQVNSAAGLTAVLTEYNKTSYINKAYIDSLNVNADTLDSLNSSQFLRSDIDITLDSSLSISGGNGLYFTAANSRIYWNGYRALEGAADGGLLQVGENYSKTRMYGNVGLNVDPSNTLHVYKNATIGAITSTTTANASLRIQDSGASMYFDGNSIILDNTGYLTTNGAHDFVIGVNNTAVMHFDNDTKVGIGNTNPTAKLHVLGSTRFDSDSVSDPDVTSITNYPAAHTFTYLAQANGVAIIGGQGSHAGTTLILGQETVSSSAYNYIKCVGDTNGTQDVDFLVRGDGYVSVGGGLSVSGNIDITGTLKTGLGSAASPALQVGDNDSGFFDSGANIVSVSLGGVQEYDFTPNAFNLGGNALQHGGVDVITTSKGFVGSSLLINKGTTYKQTYHDIYIGGSGLGGADSAIYIGNAGDGTGYGWEFYYYGSGDNNTFILQSENLGTKNKVFEAWQSGNIRFYEKIGVGHSPTYDLDVNGVIRATTAIRGADGVWMLDGDSTQVTLGSTAAGTDIHFNAGATDRMFIDGDNGYVGIATNGPGQRLHVNGNIRAEGLVGVGSEVFINAGHWSAAGSSTGYVKIAMPGSISNYSMPVFRITTYEYNSRGATVYYVSGHNWNNGVWYNRSASAIGFNPKAVKFGNDGVKDCIFLGGSIGETWTYLSVTVDVMVHPSYYASAQDFYQGVAISLVTDTTGYSISGNEVRKIIQTESGSDNTGFGTTNPDSPVDVNGRVSIRNSSPLYFGQSTDSIGSWTTRQYANGSLHNFNAQSWVWNNEGYGAVEYMRLNATGLGIGNNLPNYKLDIKTTSSEGAQIALRNTSSGDAGIYFDGSNGDLVGSDYWWIGQRNNLDFVISGSGNAGNLNFDVGGSFKMQVNTNGRVGIGTDNPLDMLHLKSTGDVQIRLEADTDNVGEDDNPSILLVQDGGAVSGRLNMTATNGLALINQYDGHVEIGQNNTSNIYISNTGLIGIGAGFTGPGYLLHLQGDTPEICIENNLESQGGILFRDTQAISDQWARISYDCSDNHIKFRYGNGVTGEGFRFTNTGTFYAAADIVAYYSFSDARLKTNVKPLENSLEKVKQLQGVSYEWIDGERKGRTEVGLIAQEVEKIVPEVVREQKRLGDDTEYKTVDYEKLTAVLIEAIKELTNKVEELENKLNGTK